MPFVAPGDTRTDVFNIEQRLCDGSTTVGPLGDVHG